MIPSSKARNPSLRKARERKISRNWKIPCHNVNALVTKEATRNAERIKFKFERNIIPVSCNGTDMQVFSIAS